MGTAQRIGVNGHSRPNGVNLAVEGFNAERLLPFTNFTSADTSGLIEAVTDLDGFSATLKTLRQMGIDLKHIPPAILRLVYNSGVAFARTCRSTEEERLRWRNSIIWPVLKGGDVEAPTLRKINKNPDVQPANKKQG